MITKSKKIIAVFLSLAMLMSTFIVQVNAATDNSQYLKLWYKFDETSGTTATDSSGNGFNGTYVNTPAWGTGISGGSFKMAGGSSSSSAPYVTIPNGVLNGVSNITIATWVKWTGSTTANQWIYALGADSNKYIFATPKGNSSTLYSAITNVTSASTGQGYTAEQGLAAPSVLAGGTWKQLVVTINTDTKTSVMYVDGIETARNTNISIKPSDLYDAAKAYSGYIGKSFYPDPYFPGEVDDFKIYSTAFTQDEVVALFNDGTPDSQVVASAKDNLNLGDTTGVIKNITLPTSLCGASISWMSSDEAHLKSDGTVVRPANGETAAAVTLTATITKNTASDTKTFAVTVMPIGSAPYSINVNTTGTGVTISPDLFGLFFEDINYGLDGGLYPELVQNKSFEYKKFNTIYLQDYLPNDSGIYAWNKVETGGGAASMAIANTSGLNTNNPNYLEITATSTGTGIGVYNTGFPDTAGTPTPGMNIVQNDNYNFSLSAKSSNYTGPIEVALTSADGSTVYASQTLTGITSDWQTLSCVLTPNASATTARLQVLMKGTGVLDIDMVSLFPQRTWNNRENGVRYDMGKMLADMQPKFLRFPGGCVVEGLTIDNKYEWKDTVGPLEQRKNNFNNWGFNTSTPYYNQSYGFGFYEFFQLAEDLGSEPVPCINSGNSHQSTVTPLDQMGPLVQDAVDLGDFCNSTDTVNNKWAKLRADMGHPAPFNIKYMEIGNESTGDNYYTRYAMFSKAMREAHPEIKLIVGGGFGMNDGANLETWSRMQKGTVDADLVDDHYYIANSKFYSSMNLYDNYDRNLGKVFVGEYASNSKNNYITDALAEASYMTHLEENGDVVDLASYAPLFAKNNFTQWSPDALYFTNTSVFGSTNYYVQKMFMRNQGDVTIPSELIKNGNTPYRIQGGIGLGSYNTAVQFDDVKVTDDDTNTVLFSDDFSGDASKWTAGAGTWAISNGSYAQSSASTANALAYTSNIAAQNYTLTLKAQKTSGSEGFLVHLGQKDTNNYIRLNIGGWSNTKSAVQKNTNGTSTLMTPYYDTAKCPSVTTGEWYNVRIEVKGNRVKCYVNDTLIFDIVDRPKTGPVYTVTSKDNKTGDIIVKVVNPQASAQVVGVNLNGASYINPVGLKTVLKGLNSTDKNTFNNPKNVAPVITKIDGLSTSNEFTLDPYSFTIFRFRTKTGAAPELQSVNVNASSSLLKAGDSVRLDIENSLMSDGSVADLGDAAVTYGTDHPELVTFDDEGKAVTTADLGSVTTVKLYATVVKDGVTIKSNEVVLSTTDNTTPVPQNGLIADYSFAQAPQDGKTVVNKATGTGAVGSAVVQNETTGLWQDNALVFSGEGTSNSPIGTWVSLPNDILAGKTSATVNIEVKPSASIITKNHFLWNIGNSGTSTYWFENTFAPRTSIKYSGSEKTAQSSSKLTADRWYSLTSVIDADTKTITFYVDGIKVGQTQESNMSLAQITDQSRNTIARAPYNDPLFQGSVATFRVYDRALAADEVKSISEIDAKNRLSYFQDIAQQTANNVSDVTITDSTVKLPNYGGTVKWVSKTPDITILEDGVTAVAVQPASGQQPISGTLTAVVTLRGLTATKDVKATVNPIPASTDPYGYLLVHFIENSAGYAEKIHLDISRGDNPEQWDPLNGGQPILASKLSTTGVRDPYLTYNPETKTYYILATDLRVFGGDNAQWTVWQKSYSTKMNIWESKDLVNWSEMRQFDVALDKNNNKVAELGMMWAPEATWVPDYYGAGKGAFVVYWSSTVYPSTDPNHDTATYSRVLWGATTDFTQNTYEYGGVFVDDGGNNIDTTMIQNNGRTYRITKDNSKGKSIYMQSTDAQQWWKPETVWTTIQTKIGSGYGSVEGPATFKNHSKDMWYLYVDVIPSTGYRPMYTTNLDSGWTQLTSGDFYMAPSTKHGGVISLTKGQYDTIRNSDAISAVSTDLGKASIAKGASAEDLNAALPKTAEVNLTYNRGTSNLPVKWDSSKVDLNTAGTYTITGTVDSIGSNLNQWVGKDGSTSYLAEDKQYYSSTAITVTAQVTVNESATVKPFTIISGGTLDRIGGIQATVKVDPTQGATTHSGQEVVVFQLMKGNTPVSIIGISKDITIQDEFTAYFNVNPNDTTYTVRAFVLDSFSNDLSAPISLAESVTLK